MWRTRRPHRARLRGARGGGRRRRVAMRGGTLAAGAFAWRTRGKSSRRFSWRITHHRMIIRTSISARIDGGHLRLQFAVDEPDGRRRTIARDARARRVRGVVATAATRGVVYLRLAGPAGAPRRGCDLRDALGVWTERRGHRAGRRACVASRAANAMAEANVYERGAAGARAFPAAVFFSRRMRLGPSGAGLRNRRTSPTRRTTRSRSSPRTFPESASVGVSPLRTRTRSGGALAVQGRWSTRSSRRRSRGPRASRRAARGIERRRGG